MSLFAVFFLVHVFPRVTFAVGYLLPLLCSTCKYHIIDLCSFILDSNLMKKKKVLVVTNTQHVCTTFSVFGDRKSFSSVQKSDAGNYSCKATNLVGGNPKSSYAYIYVDVICKWLRLSCAQFIPC